ncbi:unnamed protein product [Leuciscus chuanchicus]
MPIAIQELRPQFEPVARIDMALALCPQTIHPPPLQVKLNVNNPKGYRPISLLCVTYKLLERLILARLNPVVDSQLPKEQAGFRSSRSTTNQVTLLCQDIEDSFQTGEKAVRFP